MNTVSIPWIRSLVQVCCKVGLSPGLHLRRAFGGAVMSGNQPKRVAWIVRQINNS